MTSGVLVAGVALTASGVGEASTHRAASTTITFAESGLGTEGAQTQKAINAFMHTHPGIKVKIQVLSSDSTT